MNFQEYLIQTDPRRFPNVQITRKECFQIYSSGIPGVETIVLQIHDGLYVYRKDQGDSRLYTMDKDQNKKALSVFRLID